MDLLLRVLAAAVRRAPHAVLATVVSLTVVLGAVAGTAEPTTSSFEDFATDTPAATTAEEVDRLVGDEEAAGDELAQLAVVAPDGDVLGPEVLAEVQRLVEDLASDPAVVAATGGPQEPVVTTYADPALGAAAAAGVEIAGAVDDTVDQLHQAAVAELPDEQAAQLSVLLGGEVDGADATAGMLLVHLDPSASEAELDAARQAVNARAGQLAEGVEVYAFDVEALSEDAFGEVEEQLSALLLVAFGLIVLILAAVYRSVTDVVASLVGLVASIVWMQGIAVLLGPSHLGWIGGMNEMTMAVPILLVGLGVDYGIHLTMRAREEKAAGVAVDAAAGRAITAVGAALALATVTTVVGFLTNLANPLPPLQDFGVVAAVGVVSAFVVMATLVPSSRLLVDRWRVRRGRAVTRATGTDATVGLLGRLSAAFAPLAVRRPWAVVAGAVVLTVVAGAGATQLSTEFSQTDFFPEGSRALETVEVVTGAFGGGLDETTEVLVEGDLASGEGQQALGAFRRGLAEVDGVRTFEGTARMTPRVGASGDAAVLRVSTSAGEQAEVLAADLHALAGRTLEPAGLDARVTSEQLVVSEILDELQSSQLSGMAITLVASMLILALVFWVRDRMPMLGVLAIVSVAFTATWVLGLMAAMGIPFNVMTAMVSSLAIGIGVPFGIHVVNRFVEDRRTRTDVLAAMRHTLAHTGGALVGSAVTTVAGFGVLAFSSVPPMQQFGVVTAITIALALVTNLTVLPAMLAMWARARDRRARPPRPAVHATRRAPASVAGRHDAGSS